MIRRDSAYLTLICCLAPAVVAGATWQAGALQPGSLTGLLVLIGLGILSDKLALTFTVAGRQTNSSISFVPMFISILLFPATAALLVVGAIVVTSEFFFRNRPLRLRLFNTSQVIVAAGLAALAYRHTGGVPIQSADTVEILPFAALVVAFFIANLVVVSGWLSAVETRPFSATFRQIIGSSGGNLAYDFAVSPIALVTAILYADLGVSGILLVVLPLLLLRYSYSAKIQLQQANADLLKILLKAIETRDPYTSGHSVRVSQLARHIAEEMGLRTRTLDAIERTALLHDIGKINAIYASIIGKPAELSNEERLTIQRHATEGAEMVRSLTSFPEEIIEGIRHHHEHFDGSGYPDGLQALEIPLASRIIMISDSLDAMLSDRSYRKALSPEVVRQELLRCSGTQFDPEIARIVIASDTIQKAQELVQVRPRNDDAFTYFQTGSA